MNLTSTLYAVNNFLEQGGLALYAIFGIAVLLWIFITERFFYLLWMSRSEQRRLMEEWQNYQNCQDASQIREMLKSRFQQKLFDGMEVIKMMVTIVPLLGLLGTVYGMIEIFDVIAQNGTEDARAMATGISKATLPTMCGMAVAITGLFFQHKIQAWADKQTIHFNDLLKNL